MQIFFGLLLSAFVLFYCPVQSHAQNPLFRSYPFPNQDSLNQWKEKIFSGRTIYEFKLEQGEGFLFGHTNQNFSAMYAEVPNWDLKAYPYLSWRWKIGAVPPRNPNLGKQSDDYAARVAVIFHAKIFLNSKAVVYAYDPLSPEGSIVNSDFTSNMKIMALKTTPGQWSTVTRNVYEDYKKAFGVAPEKNPGALGYMVDANDTLKESSGAIDDIKIQKTP